ncbi:MAG: hypothetical protein JW885_15635 [Deltaproteobacteria bacterium]|nr:hypothetical protein [Candidatus Zymogenaceae bacterium]
MKSTDRIFQIYAIPAVLVLFLLAVSCTTITPNAKIAPEAFAPRITLEEALSLRDVLGGIDTLRGTVRITMDMGDGTAPRSIAGYLAIHTPDAVRFTYIGPFGVVLFEAVANGDVLTLFLPQQMIAYTADTGSNGEGADRIDISNMPFSDFFNALTKDDDDCVFFLEHRERETTLYGISPVPGESDMSWEITEKVVIDRETMHPLIRERFADGVCVSRTTYEDFQEVDGLLIPATIVITDLVLGQTMSITLKGLTINESMTDEVFETTPEEPWTIMPLDQFSPPTF